MMKVQIYLENYCYDPTESSDKALNTINVSRNGKRMDNKK